MEPLPTQQAPAGSWVDKPTKSCTYCTTRYDMCCIYSLTICRTFMLVHRKVPTKDLRLSLANKRDHVRTVLPDMTCAVSTH